MNNKNSDKEEETPTMPQPQKQPTKSFEIHNLNIKNVIPDHIVLGNRIV
jgi:hypothetical protein